MGKEHLPNWVMTRNLFNYFRSATGFKDYPYYLAHFIHVIAMLVITTVISSTIMMKNGNDIKRELWRRSSIHPIEWFTYLLDVKEEYECLRMLFNILLKIQDWIKSIKKIICPLSLNLMKSTKVQVFWEGLKNLELSST